MASFFRILFIATMSLFVSCTASNKNYHPAAKYSPGQLKEDYQLLRRILEDKHPSLYWYSSKDSVDAAFNRYEQLITDSMSERSFAWKILAPLTRQFHCGHTTVSMSKQYNKWARGKQFSSFPLYMKVWNDSMVVTGNLNRKDSLFTRGTIITSINGKRNHDLINDMFGYLPADGFSENINQVRLSANFPYYHRNIYGLSKTYRVSYLDSSGTEKEKLIPLFEFVKDSSKKIKQPVVKKPRLSKEKRLEEYRSFQIDSSGQLAVLTVNTFNKGKLRRFFRRSFRKLKEQGINSLVIDVRSNGGGHISLSTLLTKYISRKSFRVADTVYARSQKLGPYARHIRNSFLYGIAMRVISRKKRDGHFHATYLERKQYKPKNKLHYNGDVYVLTAGQTFSAAALFCNTVKGQENILLVGEETGGGWHGNNGVLIPEIRLPHSKLRVRLPLYRLIQYNHVSQNGSGILPDIYVGPSYKALVERRDRKMEVVREMIFKKKG